MNELLRNTVVVYIEKLVGKINDQLAELLRAERVLANLDAMIELEGEPIADEVECCHECAACINRCEELYAVEFARKLMKDMGL